MIGVCIVIIPTFIWWGGSVGRARRNARALHDQQTAPVAVVGGQPITAAAYQQRLRAEAERRGGRGEAPTFEQMAADGTAERVLDGLIDSALLEQEIASSGFKVDESLIIERLKKEPSFQDEKGNFNPELWNQWVSMDDKRNWNEVYQQVGDEIAREMLLRRLMAPARVTESELRKEFEQNYTKLQVKYVSIDPKITPTAEQIQAQYDKDPSKYATPAKKDVDFVAVTLVPGQPAVMNEILQHAKANEDFAELAKKYSKAPNAENGGDMGWLDQSPSTPPYLLGVFAQAVGSVSDVVQSGVDYYVFKVEEEKTNEASGARSVKVRDIMVRGQLDDAEKASRKQLADEIAAKTKENNDLSAAAAAAGLTVLSAKGVASDSPSIDNVPQEDKYSFAKGIEDIEKGSVSPVIASRMNLYVAKVIEVVPPVTQPFDAVRDRVEKDAAEEIRRSPEHANEVKKLADSVAAKGKSLKEIVEKSPELGLEIKESKEFTRKDFIAGDLMLQTVEISDAIGQKDPGAFAGPMRGFRGEQYFIELTKKTPPTEDNWKADWEKEEPNLRKSALAQKQSKLISDYMTDLRERVGSKTPIQRNVDVITKVLGMNKDKEEGKDEGDAQKSEDKKDDAEKKPVPVTTTTTNPNLGPPASE
jgi:parvulin-like peptidyl-prolyl isomerase